VAANAESVVVELEARLDKFTADVRKGAVQFDTSMNDISEKRHESRRRRDAGAQPHDCWVPISPASPCWNWATSCAGPPTSSQLVRSVYADIRAAH
jgi:hypothetical protein